MVSSYELGTGDPDLLTLLRYARLAGVSVESLIDDKMPLTGSNNVGVMVKQTVSLLVDGWHSTLKQTNSLLYIKPNQRREVLAAERPNVYSYRCQQVLKL